MSGSKFAEDLLRRIGGIVPVFAGIAARRSDIRPCKYPVVVRAVVGDRRRATDTIEPCRLVIDPRQRLHVAIGVMQGTIARGVVKALE